MIRRLMRLILLLLVLRLVVMWVYYREPLRVGLYLIRLTDLRVYLSGFARWILRLSGL